MSRLMLLLVLALVASTPLHASGELDRLEQKLHEAVNEVRREHGAGALEANPALGELARSYSRRMAEKGFFAHEDPSGADVTDRLANAGFDYRFAGENIAYNFNMPDPVEAALRNWLNSQGHRANMLNPDFTETGIGIWRQGEHYYFTQVFFTPLRP